MDLTFPQRRELLIKDLAKINDVLEYYPILRSQKQVKFPSKFLLLVLSFCKYYIQLSLSNVITVLEFDKCMIIPDYNVKSK